MRRPRVRGAVLALVGVLTAGCTGGGHAASGSGPSARTYWPTDGWRTADPADHGFEASEIAEIDRLATDAYPALRSLLIVRDGYLVYEHYAAGVDTESGNDVRSVTKSVVGTLVGIAVHDGAISGLTATVGQLLGRHLPPGADPRMAGVTLGQLLTMTSGLRGDDSSVGGDDSIVDAMFHSPDWVQHVLGRQLVADPGTTFDYSSASSHLLSAILTDATGRSTLDYAREKLFGPLGIRTDDAYQPTAGPTLDPAVAYRYLHSRTAWPVDPQAYCLGFALLRLPARDLAKIGFLYLNGGRWDGRQVVPAAWVRDSVTVSPDSPNGRKGYGRQWWIGDSGDHPAYFARGYHGQIIHVVPDLDLVTVGTSDPENPFAGDLLSLVDTAVVPAAAH